MNYSPTIYNSIDEVPKEDWERLNHGQADVFMDPRFIATVEKTTADTTRVWCVLIRDEQGRPVASACLALYRLDGGIFCQPAQRRLTERIRRLFPGWFRFRVMFCGLPVSGGQSSVRIAPAADEERVLEVLDQVLHQMAKRERASVVVFKEFDDEEAATMDRLADRGYLRGDSLPMNCLDPKFESFDAFLQALRSHYRYKIRKSQKKFAKAGFRVRVLTGEAILPIYTDRLHTLYEDVVDRAETKLELLPTGFFHELTRQFGDDVSLLVVEKDDRIVAFSWGLHRGDVYHNLFIGVDYEYNDGTDLYFNLMILDMEHALAQHPVDVHVGQTADVFKSRLGCHGRPRYVYVKCTNWFFDWGMRRLWRLLFPPVATTAPQRDLYRDPPPNGHVAAHQGDRVTDCETLEK